MAPIRIAASSISSSPSWKLTVVEDLLIISFKEKDE